jgi:lyso-ornithine lipid O-acyltransferase
MDRGKSNRLESMLELGLYRSPDLTAVRYINLFFVLVATLLPTTSLIICLLIFRWSRPEIRMFLRQFHQHWWGKLLALGLGIHIKVSGGLPDRNRHGLFIVSNHYGPIDIAVLSAVWPAGFVSRHDVVNWPGVGLLARLSGTLFANRDLKTSSGTLVDSVTRRLQMGGHVIVFAEGVSTKGEEVLPFKSPLFEAPVRAGVSIQPVTVRYLSVWGKPITEKTRDNICWYANMPFLPHMWGVLSNRGLRVEVIFGEPIAADADRKDLASEARLRVVEHFQPIIPGCKPKKINASPADHQALEMVNRSAATPAENPRPVVRINRS